MHKKHLFCIDEKRASYFIWGGVLIGCLLFFFVGCNEDGASDLDYTQIVEDVLSKGQSTVGISDTADLFDEPYYFPATDSVDALLDSL